MARKIIIDTHVFLWLNQFPEKLLPEIRELVSLPTTELFLSSASALEISIKYHLNKLALPLLPDKYVLQRIISNNLTELPITTKHALMAGGFRTINKDPFDRLLAAQAVLEELPILTADKKFSDFPCAVIWAC